MAFTDTEDGGYIAAYRWPTSHVPIPERFFEVAQPRFSGPASCAGMGSLYFPEHGNNHTQEERATIKRVCAGCPIRDECIQLGTDGNEHGLWGGYSQAERRLLKKQGLR